MAGTSERFAANGLLSRLKPAELDAVGQHFESVPLEFGRVLNEARTPSEYSYFPSSGILSAIAVMEDGDGIEVATIGNEGMLGMPGCVEPELSPYRILVQGAGSAYRIETGVLKEELKRHESLHDVLSRYQAAFLFQVSQCVACNGLHSLERRCCRWLLISHDRLGTDDLPLTHEFLSLMLGTRRASVTEVLQPLQQRGLIRTSRGKITVVNRRGLEETSCECYATVQKEFRRLLG
jgi:CRP-like cAMP-binding protein